MKKLSSLKLNRLIQSDLERREMNSILGGATCCLCGCSYANNGGSSTSDNASANNAGGLESYGGGYGTGSFH